jgi:hypothetical protein
MLTTLLLAAVISQAPQPAVKPATIKTEVKAPEKKWWLLTNLSGWEGYGPMNENGWILTEKFRRIGTTEEVPPAKPGEATILATVPAPNVQPDTGTVPALDPYGFTNWLNGVRASYGLAPVGHDPNLSSWAATNNSHQAQRGMGHYVMGPSRRQNAAYGSWPGGMWMASGGHRAALLDPTIRWIGIAAYGAYWTFNAN